MPERIQRRRTRGWRLPPGARIVDRTTRFGNPFPVTDAAAAGVENPHLTVVEWHAEWLAGDGPDVFTAGARRFSRSWVLSHLHELRGLDLACPCPLGTPCHADTLLTLANMPLRRPRLHGAGPKPYEWPRLPTTYVADVHVKGGVL